MHTVTAPYEERYKKRSAILSGIIFLLLLIALIYPFLTYPVPPIGQEGILVNLGMIDVGQGDENAASSAEVVEQDPQPPTPTEAVAPPVVEPEVEPQPEQPVVEAEPDPVPDAAPKENPALILQRERAAIALREQQAQQQREDADRIRQDQAKRAAAAAEQRVAEEKARQKRAAAEAEAQRVAEAEAARKAAEAKAAALKAGMAGMFGGSEGSGAGKGQTGTAGNQGDPNGDPNVKRLTGLSSGGAGQIGDGLENRGVLSSPKLSDNSQKTGRVVVKICVDNSGRVTQATYTQRGSNTSDETLKNLAIANARQHRFSESSTSTQCGTITYDFVVK